jgi:hypothetical protein
MTQTGPRSPEAKRRVSANAVKHGLRSTKIVIPGRERQADWEQFQRETIETLHATGPIELALAQRITELLWRLRRVPRAERDGVLHPDGAATTKDKDLHDRFFSMLATVKEELGIVEWPGDGADEKPSPPPRPKRRGPHPILPPAPKLLSLSQYEARLSRQLFQSLRELIAIQDRSGQAPPLAVAVPDTLPADPYSGFGGADQKRDEQ